MNLFGRLAAILLCFLNFAAVLLYVWSLKKESWFHGLEEVKLKNVTVNVVHLRSPFKTCLVKDEATKCTPTWQGTSSFAKLCLSAYATTPGLSIMAILLLVEAYTSEKRLPWMAVIFWTNSALLLGIVGFVGSTYTGQFGREDHIAWRTTDGIKIAIGALALQLITAIATITIFGSDELNYLCFPPIARLQMASRERESQNRAQMQTSKEKEADHLTVSDDVQSTSV